MKLNLNLIKLLVIGAFLLTFLSNRLLAEESYNIIVKIKNTESDDGQLIVYLFNNSIHYPKEKDKAYKVIKTKIKNSQAKLIFSDIPKGKYAIAVHHDENSNNEVDTNFLGIPNEDFGASNDAEGFMGPPSFKDASFDINNDIELTINMD